MNVRRKMMTFGNTTVLVIGLVIAGLGAGGLVIGFGIGSNGRSAPASAAPTSPGPVVCGTAVLTSPYAAAPAGAVTVPAGDDTAVIGDNWLVTANTTYWFAPGTHTFDGQYGQIDPQPGDVFLGAPGAIINGEGVNQSAFASSPANVTIKYLTIENFVAPEGQMTVNHDGGANWTIEYNTIENNGGAGVGIGTGDVVSNNCLTGNAEYGFSSFGGSSNVTLTNNEISFNDGSGTAFGAYSPALGIAGRWEVLGHRRGHGDRQLGP